MVDAESAVVIPDTLVVRQADAVAHLEQLEYVLPLTGPGTITTPCCRGSTLTPDAPRSAKMITLQ